MSAKVSGSYTKDSRRENRRKPSWNNDFPGGITIVHFAYTTGPFTTNPIGFKLYLVKTSQVNVADTNKRRGERRKAVLPVRIKGTDAAGQNFEDLAHTLDVTSTGVRLGSIRREFQVGDEITVFYRQRKMQYSIVWTKKMKGSSEFQVGLRALAHDIELWGLNLAMQGQPVDTRMQA